MTSRSSIAPSYRKSRSIKGASMRASCRSTWRRFTITAPRTLPLEASPMTRHFLGAAVAALILLPLGSHASDSARQAEVARRGADVMPFDLKATTHVFTKTADGGVQRVVAQSAA